MVLYNVHAPMVFCYDPSYSFYKKWLVFGRIIKIDFNKIVLSLDPKAKLNLCMVIDNDLLDFHFVIYNNKDMAARLCNRFDILRFP